jgi:hypothetical protein
VSRIRFRHAIALLALAVPVAIAAFVATVSNSGNSFQAAAIFPGAIKMSTGTYAGDLVDNRAITVGFQPDFVIVKAETGREGVARTSTMSGDTSKPLGNATAFQANNIQSFTANGFTIGTATRVNASGENYHWIAFKANSQAMQVGNYSGNGGFQALTGVGFSPELVVVLGNTAQRGVLRANGMSRTYQFSGGTGSTSGVVAFGADGFSVWNSAEVNSNGVAYHYVAFNDVANSIDIGSYGGDNADNRSISGPGFQPDYALIRADDTATARPAVQRPASLGGDNTLLFAGSAMVTNRIQALQANGFEVGNSGNVNAGGVTYYHLAVRSSAP